MEEVSEEIERRVSLSGGTGNAGIQWSSEYSEGGSG